MLVCPLYLGMTKLYPRQIVASLKSVPPISSSLSRLQETTLVRLDHLEIIQREIRLAQVIEDGELLQ